MIGASATAIAPMFMPPDARRSARAAAEDAPRGCPRDRRRRSLVATRAAEQPSEQVARCRPRPPPLGDAADQVVEPALKRAPVRSSSTSMHGMGTSRGDRRQLDASASEAAAVAETWSRSASRRPPDRDAPVRSRPHTRRRGPRPPRAMSRRRRSRRRAAAAVDDGDDRRRVRGRRDDERKVDLDGLGRRRAVDAEHHLLLVEIHLTAERAVDERHWSSDR